MPLRSDPRCLECFRRGFRDFYRRGSGQEIRRSPAVAEALEMVAARLADNPPPVAGEPGYLHLCKSLGVADLFMEEKREFTMGMLDELDRIRSDLLSEDRPESAALRAGTWGNLLDVAQGHRLPSPAEMLRLFETPLAVDHTESFLESLQDASLLLILGDNAGETVLDRLFLEVAAPLANVVYSVRPEPVMNDATRADAEMAGLHNLAEIVDTGCAAPTVIPGLTSARFQALFEDADLILSKGQGNLEGLIGTRDRRVYYSFVVKCGVIADATGLPVRSGVFACSADVPQRR